ncbi:hypothetical protein RHGRI_037318 [Rhododendron griersonianum]|uniref:Gnk2-homologous domain-containing protein n=1 Tax=Rhododendron griersonianum TaxID=479676 RepID=A0AAV6HVK5_9ERIC|nr:hypothetical protein RHGRI_037318 [Rhododendron griersonianum]
MGKFLRKIPRKALFVYSVCLLSLIPIIKGADPTFVSIDCPKTTLARTSTYAPNSTYHTNLNTLFSALSSNNASNGFYNFTAGSSPPDVVYGLFLCRGDVTAAGCRDCVAYASEDVVKRCPRSKEVTVWYEQCWLRYSNKSMFNYPDTREWFILENTPLNVTDGNHFNEVLGQDSVKNSIDVVSTPQMAYDKRKNNFSPKIFQGNGRIIAIVVSIGVTIILSIAAFCFLTRRAKKTYNLLREDNVELLASMKQESLETAGIFDNLLQIKVGEDISSVQSLQYDLGTIQAATNNFSEDHKIGEGGFGPVYKRSEHFKVTLLVSQFRENGISYNV